MNRRIKKIRPEFWLVLILVFALSLRLYFFVGLASADPQDDGIYMSNVHGILKGSYSLSRYNNLPEDYLANPAETFSFRIGFLYPCVFFSILLGVTEFSITLWPLLCSLGMIVIGFYLGKMIFNENVGLISAFLISFFPLNVLYSTRIAVDIPLAFFSILSFYFFVRAAFYEKNKRDIIYFFLSGISLGLGYLTKSMAIILFLFYFAYFLYSSYKNKKLEKSLIYVFLGFLIIFSIEGMYYYLETGNFLLHKDITTGAYLFKYKIEGASEINLVNGIKISYTD
ncbi:MAG: glycosyltransferase family 39 protein, partial [Candidatus Aenigmarchaeota archaeon]|nr:glycosyltransferase family 39 protein [Candidatus Aenigmarchaeota archaeon]